MDLFSRKIISYRIGENQSTYIVTSTFKKAFSIRNYPENLVFHSDQGSQYSSKSFYKLLNLNKVVQSFSRSGRPHDNAVMESFFSALKKEELYRVNIGSKKELYKCVDNYIDYYNTKRPHATLSYKTPDKFEDIYMSKNHKV